MRQLASCLFALLLVMSSGTAPITLVGSHGSSPEYYSQASEPSRETRSHVDTKTTESETSFDMSGDPPNRGRFAQSDAVTWTRQYQGITARSSRWSRMLTGKYETPAEMALVKQSTRAP